MKVIWLFLFLLFPFFSSLAQTSGTIENYQIEFSKISYESTQWLGLRTFMQGGKQKYLVVDPDKLKTSIIVANENLKIAKLNYEVLYTVFEKSCFTKAQKIARQNESSIQNAGIDKHFNGETGINMTMDLCPSHRPLDRSVFDSLYAYFANKNNKIPIALSVSGKWMLKHQDDLDWLKNLERSGKWHISWINHSYNHFVNKKPLSANFLLSKGTNLRDEVLLNEQLMIKNGIVPSIFFRFPGLVSDEAILERILSYGLIPIGADAWLAKGQKPVNGSIILIHGNGNEESGIKDCITLLQNKRKEIAQGLWKLYSLEASLQCYPN